MTLTHLFKAQAIFAWIWVAMFWFLLDIPAETLGWSLTENPNIQSFAQATSVPILAIGIISWMAPTWVGSDHIKKLGMLMGVYINALFVIVQLFHLSTGKAANPDALGLALTSVFIVLFFWKCRPTS